MFFGLFGLVDGLVLGDGFEAFYFERVLALSGGREWDKTGTKLVDKGVRLAFALHDHNRFGNHHSWSPNKSKEQKLKELMDLFEAKGLDEQSKSYPVKHPTLNLQGTVLVRCSRLTWENKFDQIDCVLDLEVVMDSQEKTELKSPSTLADGSTPQAKPAAAKAAALSPDQGQKIGFLVTVDNLAGALFSGLGMGG